MNINLIFNFVAEVINLFASWLSYNNKEWAWCTVRVDNRSDMF